MMTFKETTVVILGILLVGFLYIMKNSDRFLTLTDNNVIEKSLGIDLLPTEKIDTFDPTTQFIKVDNDLDIPALTIDLGPLETSTIEDLTLAIEQAITDEKYFTPENDNALFYYIKLASISPEYDKLDGFKQQLLQEITSESQLAIQQNDEKKLTTLIAQCKTLDKDNSNIQHWQKTLTTIKNINKLYQQGIDEINNNIVVSNGNLSAWYTANQALSIDPDNEKTQSLVNRVNGILINSALRAAEESDFTLANYTIDQAATLDPDSFNIQQTIQQIAQLKQNRYVWLEQQLATAIDRIDITRAERMLNQLKDISLDAGQIEEYNSEINRIKTYGKYQPLDTFSDRTQDNQNLPTMVVIPTGSYVMGSQNGPKHEKPPHTIDINYGFAVSQYEVSVKDFERFIESTKYQTDADKKNISKIYDLKTGRLRNKNRTNWQKDFVGKKAKDNDPVIHVSWYDAAAYTQWLSEQTGKKYRLLTEAEFEYILRAGSTSNFAWGNGNPIGVTENLTGRLDRSRENSRLRWKKGFEKYNDKHWGPSPVGSFTPNPFKLFDTVGNVMEWVTDCWHDSYTRAPLDGSAWVNPGCDDRVIRGGSWSSAKNEFLSSHRFKAKANFTDARLGFRIAVDL